MRQKQNCAHTRVHSPTYMYSGWAKHFEPNRDHLDTVITMRSLLKEDFRHHHHYGHVNMS